MVRIVTLKYRTPLGKKKLSHNGYQWEIVRDLKSGLHLKSTKTGLERYCQIAGDEHFEIVYNDSRDNGLG